MEYASADPTLRWLNYVSAEACETVLPLDPVHESTVGRVRIQKVLNQAQVCGFAVIVTLVMLIHADPSGAWVASLGTAKSPDRPVDSRFREHFLELIASRLVRRSSRKHVKFTSGYFEVKKGEDRARAIFNGKALSGWCRPPPNVNLPSHRQFVNQVLGGRNLIAQLDFRHWFHQIPVCEQLRHAFGLKMRETDGAEPSYYEWCSLPMGWSWSPCVAQAISWMMMLNSPKGETDPLFDVGLVKAPEAGLPTWVYTRDGRAAVSVYYDNVVVFSSSHATLQEILKRIDYNIEHFNAEVKIKPEDERAPGRRHIKKVQDARVEPVEVLGCIIRRDECGKVRVRPRGLESWMQDKVKPRMTCREVSRFVGRMIFAASLHRESIYQSEIGRVACSAAVELASYAQRGGWSMVIDVPAEVRRTWPQLEALLDEEQPPEEGSRAPNALCSTLLATDASSSGFGTCVFNNGVRIAELDQSGRWDDSVAKEHIYFQELRALLIGLESVQERVDVVVDNAALAWTIRNGVSRNKKAMEILLANRSQLVKVNHVFLVVSADNPADPGSRGDPYSVDREEKMWLAVRSEQAGVRRASERKAYKDGQKIRHDAPPEELDDVIEDIFG